MMPAKWRRQTNATLRGLRRGWRASILFVLPLASSAAAAADGLPSAERAAIARALDAANLTVSDLGYRKGPIEDRYRLPVVHRLLHDPLAIPGAVDGLLAPFRARAPLPRSLATLIAHLPDGEVALSRRAVPQARVDRRAAEAVRGLPRAARGPALRLAGAVAASGAERERAFRSLSPADRELLKTSVAWLAAEQDELGLRAPAEATRHPERLWSLLDRVRWQHIWRAGLHLAEAVAREAPALRSACGAWRGNVRIPTTGGDLCIGGVGADTHTRHTALLLDIGGDDRYERGACRGWIVDLAGDDRYQASAPGLGAGLLEVAVLWDLAGNDDYRAAGLAQGFGAFGVGLLLDDAGDDTYRADLLVQGAARTWGVGLLADRAGRDLYQAGGRFLHAPLLAAERGTYAMAQGFAIGYRPDRSGGIGILWDGAGDDAYIGGTYCQGASYWFSLGCLADDGGNDKYAAFYYAQASAMHLTVAALLERDGHDVYTVHMGAIHAIGHDWGVAMLWDAAGNDVYSGGDSRPAVGNANGIGLFIESSGDDRYFGPPAPANEARGSGSVALFVDMAGADKYAGGFADGELRLTGRWGVAWDMSTPTARQGRESAASPSVQKPAPGSAPAPSEPELERLYADACLWEVGTARDTVRRARHRLIAIGLPAARWMVDRKLAAMDSLAQRAFEETLAAIGPEAHGLLLEPLRSRDARRVASALRLVASLRAGAAGPEVMRLLQATGEVRRLAIAAAAALRLREAAPLLATDGEPETELARAQALGAIGAPDALPWLERRLRNGELPVRDACADALAAFPEGVALLVEVASGRDREPARRAMQALGRARVEHSVDALAARARDPDPFLRLTAVLALRAIGSDRALKLAEEALAREEDAGVRAAMGVRP